ncbi:MAG: Fic family protein [Mesorhizobium sp.]|uniref:Fic family protein n=1 Tax=Mesorhizobium sp. TaxID=1871066 RepID=UPI000FE32535|nr:Fic family protein [Mesorhizobium sp.]RWK23494.1 MAG: Fic family protein [Mesorhizobium sp.]RWK30917.1 MAG: Fic family protein [Mesorhizobium sp.]TIQ42649.1 MAG: Fic family protein [Mesorhizobium sp.]
MPNRDSRLGHWVETSVTGEKVRAFMPPPLPPKPTIDLGTFSELIERANLALGRLDGVTSILRAPPLFIFMYVRKEALLSSQIEGTQSSLSDLLLFEADELPLVPLNDVEEVSNYIAALEYGLDRMRGGFPLSLRLIREMHGILLKAGRGASSQPGEFRQSQNWIGGTRPGNAMFVPPPPDQLMQCLDAFEKFLHNDDRLPNIVKAALAHVQFETIHPFLDGNGRLGRLLITLFLCANNVLREPTLYLSLYFKTHRSTYYDLLQRVRMAGDWESWLSFFLEGVTGTADQAAKTAQDLLRLFEADARRIQDIGRAAASAGMVHALLQRRAIVTIQKAAQELSLSEPTINSALGHLISIGIVREVTGKQRHRVFAYQAYLDRLAEGTEPRRL